MREVENIKQFNMDYKVSTVLALVMCVIGCALLTSDGWREIFFGIFFWLASIFLVVIAIIRKRKLEALLYSYFTKELKEFFKNKNVLLRFTLERKRAIAFKYIIYVNGYVNKEDFEEFMLNFVKETHVKIGYRLLRRPASSL